MITRSETQAGALALKFYIDRMLTVNGVAWEEAFIPDSAYIDGANDVIEAADNAKEQAPEDRLNAGVEALAAAIAGVGQGDKVSYTNLVEAAGEILTAVAKVRAQEYPPSGSGEASQNSAQGSVPGTAADPNAGASAAPQTGVGGNPQPGQPSSESADA